MTFMSKKIKCRFTYITDSSNFVILIQRAYMHTAHLRHIYVKIPYLYNMTIKYRVLVCGIHILYIILISYILYF